MQKRKFTRGIAALLTLSVIICGVAAWGYWHYIEVPKYRIVSNATRL